MCGSPLGPLCFHGNEDFLCGEKTALERDKQKERSKREIGRDGDDERGQEIEGGRKGQWRGGGAYVQIQWERGGKNSPKI